MSTETLSRELNFSEQEDAQSRSEETDNESSGSGGHSSGSSSSDENEEADGKQSGPDGVKLVGLADLDTVYKACCGLQEGLKLDIFPGGSSSKKRKAPVDLHVPSSKQIKALSKSERKDYLDKLTQVSLRLATLISGVGKVQNSLLFPSTEEVMEDGLPDVSDVLVEDWELNQNTSVKQQYIEMGMWRKQARANISLFSRMDNLLRQNSGGVSRALSDQTFLEYFVNSFTNAFGSELDAMRATEPDMNPKKVAALIKAIENGSDVFGDVEKELCLTSYTTQRGETKRGGKRKNKSQDGPTSAQGIHSKAIKF